MGTQNKKKPNCLKRGKTRATKSCLEVSFVSDWWRDWSEFSEPITRHSKAKPKQSQIAFNTQLKIAPYS